MIPEGWAKNPIINLLLEDTTGFWGGPPNGKGDVPVLRSTNLRDNGTLDYSKIAYRSFPEEKIIQKALSKGDILIERSGGGPNIPVGRIAYFDGEGTYCFSNFMQRIRPDLKVCNGKFLAYSLWAFHAQGKTSLIQQATTGIRNLNYKEYLAWPILVPPLPEQKKIAAILSSVDDTIQATQDVIDQTRTVKQGLLQQLLKRGIGHTRFKQTEIGEIPQSWEFTTLGNIVNKNGLQTGPFGSQLHASEYIESGIPVVMPKDLFDGRILEDNIACVPEDVADRLMKHRIQAGDILFARRGDIGRCSLIRDSEVGWICGTGCLRARVNDKISPEFLIKFLQRPKTVKWLNENAVGQTMLNLNTQILANLPILVPPKHEQINITNIFESINDELDKLISEKSTLLTIKRGLMQDLLTGRVRVKLDGETAI